MAETDCRRSLKNTRITCKFSFGGSVYEEESRNSGFNFWVS